MRLTGRDVQRSTRRFRRRGWHASATAWPVVRVVVLLGPVEIELVPRRRLPRQPNRALTLQAVVEGLLGSIEVNGPGVRVAGVLVLEHARHGPLATDLTVDAVEPQFVPHNPAAVHAADVIDVDELERGAQARSLERLR